MREALCMYTIIHNYSMEEIGRRVKARQSEIKEYNKRMNEWKMEGEILWLVITSTGNLKDVSMAS